MEQLGRSTVPRLPQGLLIRPQVQRLLQSDAPILVVEGPAGAGKTTALAQWANRLTAPVLWITATPAIRARELLWRRLIQAATVSGLHDATSAFDAKAFRPAGVLPSSIVDFFHTIPAAVIVLDDAHVIRDDTVFEDLVDLVLTASGVQLAVSTRSHLPLTKPRSVARVDVVTVGPTDLMLQPDEMSQLLADAGLMIDAQLEATAHRAVSGSILAARLLVAALRQSDRRAPEDVVAALTTAGEDYLREFLRQTPAGDDLIEFLLSTATAETLTPDLAQQLAPTADAMRLLHKVESVGAGMGGQHDSDGSFSYSPLIRDALRSRLRKTRPAEFQRLRRIVTQWESEHGDPFLAFEIALECQDLALASQIAKQTWLDILRLNVPRIIRASQGLKIRRLQNHPVLAMLIALAHNTQSPGRLRALEYFAVAAVGARLHRKDLADSDRIILATLEGSALRVTGRIDMALPLAQKAMRLIDAAGPQTENDLGHLLPAVLANNGVTFLAHLRYPDAMRAFELAASAAAMSTRPRAPLHPLALRAGTAALSGDLHYASTLIHYPRQDDWPEQERGTYLATFYHVARTVLHLEKHDFTAASAELDLLEEESRTNEHLDLLLQLRAVTTGGAGDPLRAAHVLHEVTLSDAGRRRISPAALAHLKATAALMFTVAGQRERAQTSLDEIPRRWQDRTRLTRALIALHRNDSDTARTLLDQKPHLEPSARHRTHQHLLQAVLHWRFKDTARANDHFSAAAATLTRTGMRQPILFLPAADLDELRHAFPDPELDHLLATDLISGTNPPRSDPVRLTPREQLVLSYLAEHLTAQQIAAKLFVSVHTVKSQISSTYRKLGARTRTQALAEAVRQGLLRNRP